MLKKLFVVIDMARIFWRFSTNGAVIKFQNANEEVVLLFNKKKIF